MKLKHLLLVASIGTAGACGTPPGKKDLRSRDSAREDIVGEADARMLESSAERLRERALSLHGADESLSRQEALPEGAGFQLTDVGLGANQVLIDAAVTADEAARVVRETNETIVNAKVSVENAAAIKDKASDDVLAAESATAKAALEFKKHNEDVATLDLEISTLSTGLTGIQAGFVGTTVRLEETVNDLVARIEKRRKNLDELKGAVSSAERLNRAIAASRDDLSTTLSALRVSIDELRATNVDLQNTLESLRSPLSTLKSAAENLQATVGDLRASSGFIIERVTSLETAIADIDNVMQQLTDSYEVSPDADLMVTLAEVRRRIVEDSSAIRGAAEDIKLVAGRQEALIASQAEALMAMDEILATQAKLVAQLSEIIDRQTKIADSQQAILDEQQIFISMQAIDLTKATALISEAQTYLDQDLYAASRLEEIARMQSRLLGQNLSVVPHGLEGYAEVPAMVYDRVLSDEGKWYLPTHNGLSMSSDQGLTWTTKTFNDNYVFGMIPRDLHTASGKLIVSGERLSRDGGTTFEALASSPAMASLRSSAEKVIATDGYQYVMSEGRLRVSQDQLRSFSNSYTVSGALVAAAGLKVVLLGTNNLSISHDAGSTFGKTSRVVPETLISRLSRFNFSSYVRDIAISDKLILVSINARSSFDIQLKVDGNLFFSEIVGVYASTDGGETFSRVIKTVADCKVAANGEYGFAFCYGNLYRMRASEAFQLLTYVKNTGEENSSGMTNTSLFARGPVIRQLAGDADGTALMATVQGLYAYKDSLRQFSTTKGTGRVSAVQASGNTIIAVSDTGLLVSRDNGTSFAKLLNEIPAASRIEGRNSYIVGSYQVTDYVARTSYLPLYKSIDGGTPTLKRLAIPSYVVTATNQPSVVSSGKNVMVSRSSGYWISRDYGETFTNVTGKVTEALAPIAVNSVSLSVQPAAMRGGEVFCLYQKVNVIGGVYAGFEAGVLRLAEGSDGQWQIVNIGKDVFGGRAVQSIVVAPEGTIYVAQARSVYSSYDGVSFYKLPIALQASPTIFAEGANLFVMTYKDLSISNDGGKTFARRLLSDLGLPKDQYFYPRGVSMSDSSLVMVLDQNIVRASLTALSK